MDREQVSLRIYSRETDTVYNLATRRVHDLGGHLAARDEGWVQVKREMDGTMIRFEQ